ncbi:MAG: hypothetical protein E6G04_06255 [Actinobacteria bacterium]|nr:MAG: hypothetical protein E6G04_06255 [Actinomycetota bacterium]
MTVIAQRVRRFVPTGRRQETARVVCPVDNWSFAPKFTNGVCPLCGYKPEGVEFHAPFAARIDWFWPSMAFMIAASIAMGVLVILAYGHK